MGRSSSGTLPTTGASHSGIQLPSSRRPPRADAAANSISGTVMTLGDSCGCTSSCQRFSEK